MYIWRKSATADWLERNLDHLLRRYGNALAIIERPGKARMLVDLSCRESKEARHLQREFGGHIEKLPRDWLRRLVDRNPARPLRIGSRLIVSRAADRKANDARSIIIPAEAAFGTGEHATTAMCLRMLERVTRKRAHGWTMFDAGTGSGILAIAGIRLGAARVLAIDNDPLACSIAKRNARANRVRNIEFRTGDVLKQNFRRFDIITANLFSEILAAALPVWKRSLAGDGGLILSGVLHSQERSLVTSLRRNGFAVQETRRRGKWIALLAFRAPKKS
jgi:ribosomal protein L11 methyltransferase